MSNALLWLPAKRGYNQTGRLRNGMRAFQDQYKPYTALEDRWIRLVKILPGQDSDLIRTERSDVALTEAPSYNALSYTWGSTTVDLQQIECNGTDFFVTKNLYQALQRFRDKAEPRTMWIDAICINQSSDAECTQQIGIMVEIFSQAKEVSMWLGEHGEDPDLEFTFRVANTRMDYGLGKSMIMRPAGDRGGDFFTFFHPDRYYLKTIAAVRDRFLRQGDTSLSQCGLELPEQLREDGPSIFLGMKLAMSKDAGTHPKGGSLQILLPDFDRDHVDKVVTQDFETFGDFLLEVTKPAELKLSDADMVRVVHGLHRLLSKEYWTRAWIVQEVIVSQEASVYCGRYRINFETLRSVYGRDKPTELDIRNFTVDDMRILDAEPAVCILKRLLNIDRTTTPMTLTETAFSQLGYHRLIVRERVYNRTTLADLLTSYAEQQALDPRDRIFSLLNTLRAFASHAEDADWARSFVNYDLDKRTIFTAVATHIVQAHRQRHSNASKPLTYHIFYFCDYMSPGPNDLPSWVPEWDIPERRIAYYGGRRIKEIDTLIPYNVRISGNVLTMSGHVVDTVSVNPEILQEASGDVNDYMLDEVDLYRRIQARGGGARYGNSDNAFDAFWRTVIADNALGTKKMSDMSYDFGQAEQEAASAWVAHCRHNYTKIAEAWSETLFARKSLHRIHGMMFKTATTSGCENQVAKQLDKAIARDVAELRSRRVQSSPDSSGEPGWMASGARLEFRKRRFVETATGFFGLCPDGVQVGDVVALIAGADRPVYLRQQPGGHYLLIGSGWVCGLMYRSDKYYQDWDSAELCDIELH
ncbi:hypothetical protein D6C89_04340 [Aureobasidium pullulans]|uniref:Heterokaryon incompatibility domain-containing protein n=1 Tax=Aureobasidium pullulans TaxID=5580 RepID=A0A4V4IGN2_AURPU|nr:hypothetical protein D6D24_08656 [Aureobasidium pullulans]THW35514.1 hypothetical protein D6D21_09105 [Aureobasidium pullulans]THZ25470.1 hypothetical protein D6C89_04340 [Aureobasidium pullulans]